MSARTLACGHHFHPPLPPKGLSATPALPLAVADRVPFYDAARTVNEDLIVRRLTRHGALVCRRTEVPLEPSYTTASEVNLYLADILALFRGPDGYDLVGIEVKDWDATVGATMARGYLRDYGRACSHFYLAANSFSEDLFSIKDLGLFHLDRREVLKAPGPLRPEPALWRSAVLRLAEGCGIEVEAPLDPHQRTLRGE